MEYAEKTKQAIQQAIEHDQGARFRSLLKKYIVQMDDAYNDSPPSHRGHLGASIIGGNCARAIFYSFRWARKPHIKARLLRLFNRGHLEEARFLAMLEMIGCTVYNTEPGGGQLKMNKYIDGHFGGSLDAVVFNLPDCPNEYLLAEFKTHNDKSFRNLQKVGVEEAKPEHFTQMCIYMTDQKLNRGLYFAVNKNDDDIYLEIVTNKPDRGVWGIQRALPIVKHNVPPMKISTVRTHFGCKFCDYLQVCQYGEPPAVNCRTCSHSKTADAGAWVCTDTGEVISKEQQEQGCSYYQRNKNFTELN